MTDLHIRQLTLRISRGENLYQELSRALLRRRKCPPLTRYFAHLDRGVRFGFELDLMTRLTRDDLFSQLEHYQKHIVNLNQTLICHPCGVERFLQVRRAWELRGHAPPSPTFHSISVTL